MGFSLGFSQDQSCSGFAQVDVSLPENPRSFSSHGGFPHESNSSQIVEAGKSSQSSVQIPVNCVFERLKSDMRIHSDFGSANVPTAGASISSKRAGNYVSSSSQHPFLHCRKCLHLSHTS